jgi:coatomer subunit beta
MSYFIISNDDVGAGEETTHQEISKALVNGTIPQKKKAMKILIKQICNDENYPRMLMTVLTHVHILDDNEIKKLLFLYWEIVEKTNPDGTVKDEITLACNALR